MHAQLVEDASDLVARAVLRFHRQDGRALGALRRIGLAHHQHQAGEEAVGDVGLAAVQDIVVAVPFGARADALQVRAGAWLRHGDGADQLAARHARQPALLLRLGAVVQQVVRDDRMHRGAHAREAAARHLLVEHGLVAEVAAGAAIRLRNVGAQEAQLAGAPPQRMAHVPAPARLGVARLHLLRDEARHAVTPCLQVGIAPGTREVQRHARNCPAAPRFLASRDSRTMPRSTPRGERHHVQAAARPSGQCLPVRHRPGPRRHPGPRPDGQGASPRLLPHHGRRLRGHRAVRRHDAAAGDATAQGRCDAHR